MCAKPAHVQYHPVVDRFPLPTPLDPMGALVFTALFAITTFATLRRPAYGLAALLFAVPFAWYHDVGGTTITFPKVILLGVIVGLLGHQRAWSLLKSRAIFPTLVAIAAIIAVTLATFFVAVYHAPVIREALKAAEYGALIAVAYLAYRIDPDNVLVRRAFVFSAIIVMLSALVQEGIGAPSGLKMGEAIIPRIAGVLEGPNQLAGYCEIALALGIAWQSHIRSRAVACMLVLTSAALVLTFSRGGWIGSAVVLLSSAWLLRRESLHALRTIVVGVLGGAAVAGMWAILVHSFAIFRVSSFESSYAGGVGNRAELWRAAWFFFRTHPLIGIGAGNYELELAQAGVYGVRTHANSWYLQSLAEGGILLFGAVIAFLVAVIAALAQAARRSPWTTAALTATIALCVHQVADYLIFYPKVGAAWMILIGIGIAATEPDERLKCG